LNRIKEIREGNYSLKVIPTDNKSWNDTDKLEVAFSIKTDTETKTFKGFIDLFGIVRSGD